MKRLYPDQPIVGVGAIIFRECRILLAKRKNEPASGQWTIPGGLVEVGESLQEAILRETEEETGLHGESPELLDVVDQVHLDNEGRIAYHYVIIDFIVKTNNSEPKAASDVSEVRWVSLDEVQTYDLTPSFRRFFEKNKKRLEMAAGLV